MKSRKNTVSNIMAYSAMLELMTNSIFEENTPGAKWKEDKFITNLN